MRIKTTEAITRLSFLVLAILTLCQAAYGQETAKENPEEAPPNSYVANHPPPPGPPQSQFATPAREESGLTRSELPRRAIEVQMPAAESAQGSLPVTVKFADIAQDLPEGVPETLSSEVLSHVQGEQDLPLSTFDSEQDQSAKENSANADAAVPETSTPSQTRGTNYLNFEALDSTGWIPPDHVIAVGTSDIVEATNSGFAIYSKLGRQIRGYTTFNSFLGSLDNGLSLFDPRIQYNPSKNKYVMLVVGRNPTTQISRFFVMVSQTNLADGDWWLYSFPANGGGLDAWMDYPSLGADDTGIYVSGNMFFWAGGFKRSRLQMHNPTMWTGGASNGWQWTGMQWASGSLAFGLQAASPHITNTNREFYLVNTFSGAGTAVNLWTVTAPLLFSDLPSLARTEITGLPNYYGLGENVNQPGTATDIDGGDSRVMNAIYANRRVFFTLGSDPDNNGSRGSWYTVKLNSDNGTSEWSHELRTAGEYYTYPAITLQGNSTAGNLGIFGTWTNGTNRFPTVIHKIYEDQPNSGAGEFEVTSSGTHSYVALDSGGRNRWGDYSGADYDWTCRHLVGVGERTDALNSWTTQIVMTDFDGEGICPRIDITSPIDTTTVVGGEELNIQWNRSGLPGTDDVYIRYITGGVSTQIAGPLSPSSSSFLWETPTFSDFSDGKIFVGSWNGSSYTASDRSDFTFTNIGCVDDVYEADDTCFGPSVALPSNRTHKSCDQDWRYFNTVAGANYRIETSALINNTDTVLELYHPCSTLISTNDDGGAGYASLINFQATQVFSMDVLVRQWQNNYDADEGYDLNISCTACCDGSCWIFGDGFESGNTSQWSSTSP